uniref:Uncharacterized protein n=1 Tax=Musa acuminata subsp. malaccensis TaxID=214687 RepID=A0A804HRX1_MUSAM
MEQVRFWLSYFNCRVLFLDGAIDWRLSVHGDFLLTSFVNCT